MSEEIKDGVASEAAAPRQPTVVQVRRSAETAAGAFGGFRAHKGQPGPPAPGTSRRRQGSRVDRIADGVTYVSRLKPGEQYVLTSPDAPMIIVRVITCAKGTTTLKVITTPEVKIEIQG